MKPCFVCALDASKAFDKVERTRLYNKMFEKGINPAIIFSIIAYYAALRLMVVNGKEKSELFETINGVRQGGIMSPKLYNIYSDELIQVIKRSFLGIGVGLMVIGILMYADDLILIVDTTINMQTQLDTIGIQGANDDIKFNPKKSVMLIFNCKEPVEFKLNGDIVPIVNDTRYLGYQLSNNTNNMIHLKNRESKCIAKIAKLKTLGLISSNMSPQARAFLFKTYLRPLINFGIDNCDLDENELTALKRIEGNALKALVGLNKEMKSTGLFSALNVDLTGTKVIKDKLNLFTRLCNNEMSNNLLIQFHKEFESCSMITMVSNYVEYDCSNLVTTDYLKTLALKKVNQIKNDADSIRKIHPQRNEILEVLNDFKNPLYKLKMRELIGFEPREEKFNNSSFLKSFNFN